VPVTASFIDEEDGVSRFKFLFK